MARSQRRSRRKPTGGLYKKDRKKRKRELAREPAETKIDTATEETKKSPIRHIRARGGQYKLRLLRAKYANVATGESGIKKVEILDVEDNTANKEYARRKIITKGALIRTPLGVARVTSRPGQHSVVNAILIESSR